MGLLSGLLGAAAPFVGNLIAPGIGGVLGSALGGAIAGSGGAKQSGTQTVTTQQQLDPRAQAILYGDGTDANKGLLGQYQQFLNQPQGAGTGMLGAASQNWLSQAAPDVLNQLYAGSSSLLGGHNQAPQAANAGPIGSFGTNVLWNTGESFNAPKGLQAAQIGAPQQVSAGSVTGAQVQTPQGMQPSYAGAAQVNAPSQNGLDLTGAYQHFTSGASGDNPYIGKSLQAGVDLTNAGFNKNVNTLTDMLRRQVLPGIRSNSVLAGQYGGSRQGIAEGNAIGDYTRQLTDANSILGAQNSANVSGQLANTYNQGQDRALSATQGLGAQQYGVASQDASMQQQSNLSNQAAANAAAQNNYQGLLSGALANAGYSQQANLANQSTGLQSQLANQGANLQAGTTNAQLQQQAGLNNYAGDLQAIQQSAANRQNANLANQAAGNNASNFNAGQQQQASILNSQMQQQNNQFNAGMQQQNNQLNQQGQLGGLGALSGLLSSVNGYGNAADNYQLNRASQVNGLLAPYLSMGGSSTQSQPLYTNPGANILGGASAGLGLYGTLKNLGIGGGSLGSFASNNAGLMNGTGLSMNDILGGF